MLMRTILASFIASINIHPCITDLYTYITCASPFASAHVAHTATYLSPPHSPADGSSTLSSSHVEPSPAGFESRSFQTGAWQ